MSVLFTNSGDTLSRADTSIAGTSSRSFALWVRKPTNTDNAFLELFYGATWNTFCSTFAGDMYIGDYDGTTALTHIFTFATGQWYHIAYSYDGTNVTIWLDGVQVLNSAWNSTGAPAGTSWSCGQSSVEIYNLVLHNATMTAAQVAAHRAGVLPKRTTNLLAWYPFFAGASRNVDYSGQGRALTAAGTPADGTTQPPCGWGGGRPRVILPAASAVSASGTGQTLFNGAGTAAVAAADSGTGLTVFNGIGTATVTIAASATGMTRFNGTATASGTTTVRPAAPAFSRRGGVVFGGRRRIR